MRLIWELQSLTRGRERLEMLLVAATGRSNE
jgi:hypothetical protein